MKTRFLKAAQRELSEAVAYYENVRPTLGADLRDEVDAALDRIEARPHTWSRASKNARMCPTKRFPYVVIYVPLEREIVVVAVMHTSRRPGYWKRRLKDLGP